MKVLILGVNGFIGHALVSRILKDTDWDVYGLDMYSNKIDQLLSNPRFRFLEGVWILRYCLLENFPGCNQFRQTTALAILRLVHSVVLK